jgi:hypothetical protein
MVQITGTYTTVKGQDFVDFYVAMGNLNLPYLT